MLRVEYLAHWAEVQRPFLARDVVMAIKDPFEGRHLETQLTGVRKHRYFAHGDLSLTHDNTVLMVGHPEAFDDPGRPHMFIDYAEHWSPDQFNAGHIDLTRIETINKQRLHDFDTMERLTFDSFQSAGMIQRLRDYARARGMHTYIGEFTPNRQKALEIGETTKVALYERRIHAPHYPLLIDELLYLQDLGDRVDHPSTGPVITNDYVTCLFAIVAAITEAAYDPGARLANIMPRSMRWPATASDQRVFDSLGGGPPVGSVQRAAKDAKHCGKTAKGDESDDSEVVKTGQKRPKAATWHVPGSRHTRSNGTHRRLRTPTSR